MSDSTASEPTFTLWYYNLCQWVGIETIVGEDAARKRAASLAGREPYLRVAPAGASPDDYLRAQEATHA